MADFGGARKWARTLVENSLFPGARAVDATLGNGQDALWMAEKVGERGRVYGFDVQEEAVKRSSARLLEAGVSERCALFQAGHERMAEYVESPVDAVVFNLGWLPGSPRECTTRVETTLSAVNQALALIKEGGVLTICVYPGHEEGKREREALLSWAGALDDAVCDALVCGYANLRKLPPLLIAVTKRTNTRHMQN